MATQGTTRSSRSRGGSYKVGRQPRNATQLQSLSNGMYVTNQTIPEGYAKYLVNYDIDDTGSFIKPKMGRRLIAKQEVANVTFPGPAHFSDFVYQVEERTLDKPFEGTSNAIKDLVLSFGTYKEIAELIPGMTSSEGVEALYVSDFKEILDTNVYDDEGDVLTEGEIIEHPVTESWAIVHKEQSEEEEDDTFTTLPVNGLGYVAGRLIKDVQVFDKMLKGTIGYPIQTTLNNELYLFGGPQVIYNNFPANPELNSFASFASPRLNRMRLVDRPETGEQFIQRMEIIPRQLNAAEAMSNGFNMLHSDPYTFRDSSGSIFEGLAFHFFKDKEGDVPEFGPAIGDLNWVRVYHQYVTGKTMNYKVEYASMSDVYSDEASAWSTLRDWGATATDEFPAPPTAGDPLWFAFTPTHTRFFLRITLREANVETSERSIGDGFDTEANPAAQETRALVFDLNTAEGSVPWAGCLGLYGVKGAEDVIFFSAVNDPRYFPYPQNTVSFETDILAVHPYLDKLLVITKDSVWILSLGANIMSSVKKKVFSNLYISEIDALNVQVLKDQIFLKADNQFFVLKPNSYTSDSTDLKNFTNSTAIANFCNNFTVEVVSLLNRVFPNVWQDATFKNRGKTKFIDFNVLNIRSHVQSEDVHYVYTLEPILGDPSGNNRVEEQLLDRLNLHLIYDTVSRAWRIHFRPIGETGEVAYGDVLFRNKTTGKYYEFFSQEDGVTIASQEYVNPKTKKSVVSEALDITENYENHPYIDTGNVALNDVNTKRFREVQFSMYSREPGKLRFNADFRVDGAEQVSATHYEVSHITDKDDPDYGSIFVSPREVANVFKYQDSSVGEEDGSDVYWENKDESLSDLWQIDLSSFPELDTINVKLELRGRGRRGSIQLLNTSLQTYELSTWTWVYRMMSAR